MNRASDPDLVVSYFMQRQLIGWAGLLMPAAVRLGAYWLEGIHTTDSISAYYYTAMRDVFVSTLVLVGVLLACYRSRGLWDNVAAIVCGVSAVGVGLFPMDPTYAPEILAKFPQTIAQTCYMSRGVLGYHFVFVAGFFVTALYLVFFNFPKLSAPTETQRKRQRNTIYKVCGWIMLVSMLAIAGLAFGKHGDSIFWPETAAVVAFAAAWLVKGQLVLKDTSAGATGPGNNALGVHMA